MLMVVRIVVVYGAHTPLTQVITAKIHIFQWEHAGENTPIYSSTSFLTDAMAEQVKRKPLGRNLLCIVPRNGQTGLTTNQRGPNVLKTQGHLHCTYVPVRQIQFRKAVYSVTTVGTEYTE
jgi:hypothetical protein